MTATVGLDSVDIWTHPGAIKEHLKFIMTGNFTKMIMDLDMICLRNSETGLFNSVRLNTVYGKKMSFLMNSFKSFLFFF